MFSLRLTSCVLILACQAVLPATVTASDSPPGAALLKTDLLGVFAHPDDETGMAATIASYALGEKKVIAHAYLTRGEGGGNMVGTQAGAALGVLREAELRDCLDELGVRYAYFLGQTDFFYTESLAATLRKWDQAEALRQLVRLIRALRPEVIVTMNPAPNPGQHGHHQAAGILATEAFTIAANPDRYPEQIRDEGLGPWQARKLFYGGTLGVGGYVTTVATTRPLADGRIPADVAGQALAHHRSQGFGRMAGSPWLRRPQTFTLVKSAVRMAPETTDLFAGLPAEEPVQLLEFAFTPDPARLAFAPRPAIARFLEWTDAQRIRHVTAEFPVDLPVVAGETNSIRVVATGDLAGLATSDLRVLLPAGWRSPGQLKRLDPLPASGTRPWQVLVEPPPNATDDVEIVALARAAGGEVAAKARLHPVPRGRVARVSRMPAVGFAQGQWPTGTDLRIPSDRTWQGQASSPEDCSAEVRLLHDGERLGLEVRVRDDVVVSNIEPNDIKGHWRSDSIEICLDPAGGAEDTTGCFKLGILPFDTSGQARAARDADARQGPMEDTAPGLELASERLPDGYRVRAIIPLNLLGPLPRPTPRLGFNVLIYDGDKADAAPGENINECRLAWSPRPGVQGRPEDWGRLDLE